MCFEFRLGAAVILLLATSPALAQTGVTTATPPDLGTATSRVSAQSGAENPFGTVASVAGAQLEKMTGQADVAQQVQANNTSTVANNTVEGNSVTGDINFGGGAFQNLNGLSVLSANSGNNVAINASLNVNVSIRP